MRKSGVRTVTIGLAGCPLIGEHYTRRSGGRVLLDSTTFRLGQITATVQVMDLNKKNPTGEATLTVSGRASRVTFNGLIRTAMNFCWLLSLATNSRIVPYDVPTPSGRRLTAFSSWINSGRSHIALLPGNLIRSFVEQTWATYVREHRRHRLVVPIEYLLIADLPSQFVEVSSLLTFVAWESLKHSWARNAGLPFEKGRFRDPRGKPIGFVALSRRMLASVGIRKGVKRLAVLRNQIVHTGVASAPPMTVGDRTAAARVLLLQYLFRFLGFRGQFAIGRHRAVA